MTEKKMARVLVSSICGMLLCMACLAGTTWAWFTVDIENTENVIQIAEDAVVNVKVNENTFTSGDTLPARENTILIEHAHGVDALDQKSVLYVTLTFSDSKSVCVKLGGQYSDSVVVNYTTDQVRVLSWVVTWFVPANVDLITEDSISITDDAAQLPPETTVPSEPAPETTAPEDSDIEDDSSDDDGTDEAPNSGSQENPGEPTPEEGAPGDDSEDESGDNQDPDQGAGD